MSIKPSNITSSYLSAYTTQALTYSEIINHSEYEASSVSLSGGYNITNETPNFSASPPIQEDGESTTTTYATLTEGNINIGGTRSNASDLGIHTDIDTAHEKVEDLPDLQAILEEQKAMAAAANTVIETSQQAIQDIANATDMEIAKLKAELNRIFFGVSDEEMEAILNFLAQNPELIAINYDIEGEARLMIQIPEGMNVDEAREIIQGNVENYDLMKEIWKANQEFIATIAIGGNVYYAAGNSSATGGGQFFTIEYEGEIFHIYSGQYAYLESGAGASATGASASGGIELVFLNNNYNEALNGPYMTAGFDAGLGATLGLEGVSSSLSFDNPTQGLIFNLSASSSPATGYFRTGYGWTFNESEWFSLSTKDE